jgi:predicted tellurium resistance membrane protein TerC
MSCVVAGGFCMRAGRVEHSSDSAAVRCAADRVIVDFQTSDLLTIGILVVLEGLLSADNALVMAVMVLGLPPREHQKALRYGLIGAFAFRIVATLLATHLIQVVVVKLLGGLYLAYLAFSHFRSAGRTAGGHAAPRAGGARGHSALLATVVSLEAM